MGRATYDSAQEIRNGEIDREEGVELVRKFDGEYPIRFENELFEYLSIDNKNFPKASTKLKNPIMSKEYFNKLTEKFRSLTYGIILILKKKWKLRKLYSIIING